MKTNSLVILALLGESQSLNLKSRSVVNLKINGVVFADDFDAAGEMGQMGYDSSQVKLMQQATDDMTLAPSNSPKNTTQNIQTLSQSKEAAHMKMPTELGFPGPAPSAGGIGELGLPVDKEAQKVKALGKAKGEASDKVAEATARVEEAQKLKEEAAKKAVANDLAEKEAAKRAAEAKAEETAALKREIAQKQAAIKATAEEATAKADAKEAAELTKKLAAEEAEAVAAEESHEKQKAENAKAQEAKKKEIEEHQGDCTVNKFDGLCHDANGHKYHPTGVKAMGVNEWVGTNSEISQKEQNQHHEKQKDGNKEKNYQKEHKDEPSPSEPESESPSSQQFKSGESTDWYQENVKKHELSSKKDKKHHHHHSNKSHSKHKKHSNTNKNSEMSDNEVTKEEITK